MIDSENNESRDPLFSILTVTYNAADTIMPTLQSVRQQSCTDYEHLIVDGLSKDDTVRLARSAGNPRLRIISERDNGLYEAMNKALHAARGRYVIFLNAGDSFHSPDSLAAYAAAAAPTEGAPQGPDIIYSDTVLVDADRQVIGPRHLSVPERLTFESFSHGMLICHQAFAMRRELAPDYDRSYRFSADYDWTVRCIQSTVPERCRNLHAVHIDYLSEGLTTANHKASLRERYRIMCRHYGGPLTLWRHLGFALRDLRRRLS